MSHAGQSAFQFNTSNLEPGIHKFILEANDGYGGSTEKVYLFKVAGGEHFSKGMGPSPKQAGTWERAHHLGRLGHGNEPITGHHSSR